MAPQRNEFSGDQSVPVSILVSVEEDSSLWVLHVEDSVVLETGLELVHSFLVLVDEVSVVLEAGLELVRSLLALVDVV